MSTLVVHPKPVMAADAGPALLGGSSSIAQLRAEIEMASHSDAKVLIAGETGVGKEIVARLIHRGGRRRSGPFVAINCAGLPDSLLESELFGHVRGSFTDAYRDKPGLAAMADKGTLFLDEFGEMSPRMQAMLLRFLETGEIHRLGADRIEMRVDVRIVAATNRNLLERVSTGNFREDLYYRLNVIHVEVPPLRDRGTDIVLLFTHYLNHYCRTHSIDVPQILPSAKELLLAYRWPGNVRELKNVAERIAVRQEVGSDRTRAFSVVEPAMLPVEIRQMSAQVLRAGDDVPTVVARPAADAAWNAMVIGGANFWTAVHAPFMERELTKSDVKEIIRRGLRETQGNYRKLIATFHLPEADYKRFLAFLYQHDCHLSFHSFREPVAS